MTTDRGQLIVVSALVLAMLFVGLAVVINSAIYAENASTKAIPDTVVPIEHTSATEERLQESVRRANYDSDDESFEERAATVTAELDVWAGTMTSSGSVRGTLVAVDPVEMTEGVRVSQDTTRWFMPVDETLAQELADTTIDPLGVGERTTWVVSTDAAVRDVWVAVERDSLKTVDQGTLADVTDLVNEALTGSDVFSVHFDDDGDVWGVYLVNVTTEGEIAAVVTEQVDGDEEVRDVCRIEADRATVHLSENELVAGDDTTPCPGLAFTDDLDRPDVYFVGGDEAEGTYRFLADQPEAEFRDAVADQNASLLDDILDALGLGGVSPEDFFGTTSDDDPYTTGAVYDTTVRVTYEDHEVRFVGTVTATG